MDYTPNTQRLDKRRRQLQHRTGRHDTRRDGTGDGEDWGLSEWVVGWLAGWMVVLAAAGYFRHAHQTSRGGYIIILIIITYTTLNQWGLEMPWKKFPLLFETGNGNSEAEPTKSNGR